MSKRACTEAEWRGTRCNTVQDYIHAADGGAWHHFPAPWCVSYADLAPVGAQPGPDAKLVIMHGEPKPAEVVAADPSGWVARLWHGNAHASV